MLFTWLARSFALLAVCFATVCSATSAAADVASTQQGTTSKEPRKQQGAKPKPAPATPAIVADPLPRYEFQPGVLCPFCAITPQFPQAESGLHWHHHWQAVGVREYVVTGAFAALALSVELLIDPESDADWNSPILFDRPVRNALRVGTSPGRETAKDLSDILFYISIAHPVVDDLIFAWWLRESPQVAWQLFVINAQAYSLTLALNVVSKRLTARARPWAQECGNGSTDPRCQSAEAYSSFYSGHAAVTATGAGLICAHHTQLSLYRNDILDAGACITAVLGTALTGGLRIASDNHWASDVIVGHLMGYLVGYLYPTLMYYREFRVTPEGPGEHAPQPQQPTFTLLPLFTPNALQLTMLGSF